MIVINEQLIDFSKGEGLKMKNEFIKKHGLDATKLQFEFRRNPDDFFMQGNEKGDKRLMASASKGIPFRYFDKDNRAIMYVENYVPSIGIEKAVITKADLKFRYVRSITVTEFDKVFFLLEHPSLKGSDLNKSRHPKGDFLFYVFDQEKEAKEKVDRQRMEFKAMSAIEAITSTEELRIVARGFQIQNTENKSEFVLRDELAQRAKTNPKDFTDKIKTDEFKVTGLVYEAKEKGNIIYQPHDRSWYLQGETVDGKKEMRDKIYTITAGEKPEESLITWLQSVKSGNWRKQLNKILETESVE